METFSYWIVFHMLPSIYLSPFRSRRRSGSVIRVAWSWLRLRLRLLVPVPRVLCNLSRQLHKFIELYSQPFQSLLLSKYGDLEGSVHVELFNIRWGDIRFERNRVDLKQVAVHKLLCLLHQSQASLRFSLRCCSSFVSCACLICFRADESANIMTSSLGCQAMFHNKMLAEVDRCSAGSLCVMFSFGAV